jgi:RHS repeat-associated protein
MIMLQRISPLMDKTLLTPQAGSCIPGDLAVVLSSSNEKINDWDAEHARRFVGRADFEEQSPVRGDFFVWGENHQNRMISATVNSVTTNYYYDSQSRRIAHTTGSTTTFYLYQGWNCIAEYTGSSVLTKTLTWGMDLSGSMQGAGGVGGLLSITDHSSPITSHFPIFDGNGNVSEYIDSSAAVVAHYEYDPFGNTTVASFAKANDFIYRFSTKPLDAATGLYYYGYRWYDPLTGRWPSRDPIAERGGMNLYGFVLNNAFTWIDYLGLDPRGLNTDAWNKITSEANATLQVSRNAKKYIKKRLDDMYGEDSSASGGMTIQFELLDESTSLKFNEYYPCSCADDLGRYKNMKFTLSTTTSYDTYQLNDPGTEFKEFIIQRVESTIKGKTNKMADDSIKKHENSVDELFLKFKKFAGTFTSTSQQYAKFMNIKNEVGLGLTITDIQIDLQFDICAYKDGKYQYVSTTASGNSPLGTGFSFMESYGRDVLFDAYWDTMTQAAKDVSDQIDAARK